MYTANDFKNDLRTDIWILEQINNLPADPLPTITVTYDEETGITNTTTHVVESIHMPFAQEEVRKYRNRLIPVFFSLSQKVYAEFFRLILGLNSLPSDKNDSRVDTQSKVGTVITANIASLTVSPLFSDRQEFNDWWQGRYQYNDLRLARNKVTHDEYDFDGCRLLVKHKHGTFIWTVGDVLSFATCVLVKAKTV